MPESGNIAASEKERSAEKISHEIENHVAEHYASGELVSLWCATGQPFCIIISFFSILFTVQHPFLKYEIHFRINPSSVEKELKSLGVKAIRLDVFCENPYALKLYRNHGFQKTGVACWRKGKFLLMEKQI